IGPKSVGEYDARFVLICHSATPDLIWLCTHPQLAPKRSRLKLVPMEPTPGDTSRNSVMSALGQKRGRWSSRCGGPCPLFSESGQTKTRLSTSALCQKQTLGNDGLLRCRSRFFDQCCHLGCVRKKDRVAARKFNDLRLRPLRHESLELRSDHSVLHGNYCVARLFFPSRNCGLRLQCIT